jgi:hypothetical protein
MSDVDLKVAVGKMETDVSYIRKSIDEIKDNYSTRSNMKLTITEALERHESSFHNDKSPLNNKVIIGLILLALMGGGGAAGNIVTELLLQKPIPAITK